MRFALALLMLVAMPALAKPVAVDGDTLRAKHATIRLANVCVAERGEPGFFEAKARLQSLVDRASHIYFDCSRADKYGRLVCKLYIDHKLVTQSDIGPRAGRAISLCALAR